MPLLWNESSSHLLGSNEKLALAILNSIRNILDRNQLCQIQEVFATQVKSGIIAPVDDIDHFKRSYPNHSFLSFMPVFREKAKSTKCRVVFLSNLSQKGSNSVSHNEAMFSGPTLNHKMSSSLLHLRFQEKICTFDIVKAFNNGHFPNVVNIVLCFVTSSISLYYFLK